MRIIRSDANIPRAIADWGSHGVAMWRISEFSDNDGVRVSLGRYEPGSELGRHPTGSWQAFAIVDGGGWVEGGDGARVEVAAGDVVVWEPGEEHTSGTDDGMLVSIVQTTRDPASGALRA
jgi:quercetin dioxygenase-like cupin family protein